MPNPFLAPTFCHPHLPEVVRSLSSMIAGIITYPMAVLIHFPWSL